MLITIERGDLMNPEATLRLLWWIAGAGVFLVGLCIGSFLNVVIYRVPQKMSLLTPPSHCTSCQTRLKPWDLVPVFSYLALGRRCRTCKRPISPRYMMVELLTGVLFFLCYWRMPNWMALLPALALTGVLIAAACIDAEHSIIPNGIVMFGAVAGALGSVLTGHPAPKDALLGALCGGGPLFLIDVLTRLTLGKEGMGGGDVKLMAMAGLFLGVKAVLMALMLGVMLGGLTGAVLLITKRVQRGGYFPFGPFLAAGVFISQLFYTDILELYFSFNESIIKAIAG